MSEERVAAPSLPEFRVVGRMRELMLLKFANKREKRGGDAGEDGDMWWPSYLAGETSTDYLILRMVEEMGELVAEYRNGNDPYKVALEAADVANFAALLAYRMDGMPYE